MNETTSQILARIEALQAIQKRNPPVSAEWQNASFELQPLFLEMARRQQFNGYRSQAEANAAKDACVANTDGGCLDR